MTKITLYPSRYIDCTCDLQEQIAPSAYHGLLPNGKRTVAFVERRDAELLPMLRPGCRVWVTLSPADFDRARIRGLQSPENGV